MKKVKLVSFILIVALLGSLMLGCGGGKPAATAPQAPKEEQKPLNLRSADVVTGNSPYIIGMNEKFVKLVDQYTKGRIKVTHFPGGQLGSDSAILDGVKMGSIDMAIMGNLPSKYTDALYVPFLFKDAAHQHRVLDGEIGEKLREAVLKETGIRVVGFVYFAPRQLTTNKPIASVADLKGLKIRVPQMPPYIATWKALGANPTPIAFTELFTALQQGIVDAQENPLEIILNSSFNEVQKYVVETNHMIPVRFFIINNDLWNKLSDQEKEAINKAWKESSLYMEKLYIDNEANYRKQLEDKGMKFIQINVDEFREATKDVWKEFFPNTLGEDVYHKIVELRDK